MEAGSGNPELAYALLTEGIEILPEENAPAYVKRGKLLKGQNRTEEALADVDKALAILKKTGTENPNSCGLHCAQQDADKLQRSLLGVRSSLPLP